MNDDWDAEIPSALEKDFERARTFLKIAPHRSPPEVIEEVKRLKSALSENISLESKGAIYRLWGEGEGCLYIGQSARWHPILRIAEHRREKSWWDEVKRADFISCSIAFLDDFERYQILLLRPKYNKSCPPIERAKLWLEEACA